MVEVHKPLNLTIVQHTFSQKGINNRLYTEEGRNQTSRFNNIKTHSEVNRWKPFFTIKYYTETSAKLYLEFLQSQRLVNIYLQCSWNFISVGNTVISAQRHYQERGLTINNARNGEILTDSMKSFVLLQDNARSPTVENLQKLTFNVLA